MMLAVSFPRSLKKRKKRLLLGGGGYKSNIRLAFGIMTSNNLLLEVIIPQARLILDT